LESVVQTRAFYLIDIFHSPKHNNEEKHLIFHFLTTLWRGLFENNVLLCFYLQTLCLASGLHEKQIHIKHNFTPNVCLCNKILFIQHFLGSSKSLNSHLILWIKLYAKNMMKIFFWKILNLSLHTHSFYFIILFSSW
jgi:hypothetical protein